MTVNNKIYEKFMVFKLIKKFPICMEEESSLLCSKRPVLDPIMIQLNSVNLFVFCFF